MTNSTLDVQILKPIMDVSQMRFSNVCALLPINLAEKIASSSTENPIVLPDVVSAATIPFDNLCTRSTNSTAYSNLHIEELYKNLLDMFDIAGFETESDIQPISSTASDNYLIAERNFSALENAWIKAHFWSPNWLTAVMDTSDLWEKLREILALGRTEVFEDGMETEFSRKLVTFIKTYHNLAIQVTRNFINSYEVNSEILSEALRWIGDVSDGLSRKSRRELLEACLLNSHYARERDGALIGLASMNDPESIPSLKLAIEREEVKALQLNMKQVLEQLVETQAEGLS